MGSIAPRLFSLLKTTGFLGLSINGVCYWPGFRDLLPFSGAHKIKAMLVLSHTQHCPSHSHSAAQQSYHCLSSITIQSLDSSGTSPLLHSSSQFGALPLSSVNRSHHARMPSQEGVHSERSVQDDKGWQIPPSALHLSPKHSLLGQILQVPGFWDMRI